jgi:CBS domain-containing membrane protein
VKEDSKDTQPLFDVGITDDDIYDAMKDITGYLDVTPGDLKELYRHAYRHAVERIAGSVRVRDVMTRAVYTVTTDTPLLEVAGLMAEKQISGVPVMDESGAIAGVISEKDFLSSMGSKDKTHIMAIIAQCLRGKGCVAVPIRTKKAGDLMTAPAVTVREDASVFDAMELFHERNINRAPVVNAAGDLAGIVSRADIMRAPGLSGKKG